MATFSTNQTRQLYVATENTNTIFAGTDEHIYLTQTNATKEPVRSDLIEVKNIISATLTPAAKMERKLKAVKVTLAEEALSEGSPLIGQDYILRINFRQFASLGDQDTYVKYGAVHVVKGMDASKFYATMAISLAKNFSRELTKLVEIKLGDTVVKPSDTLTTLNGSYDSITIEEVPQEWTRGIKEQAPVYFDVIPATIYSDGEEVVWGNVDPVEGGVVGNGKLMADLEYFCMGERGDVYRNIGWPNSIPTKYLVDETKEYDVIDIHYAYIGSNESVQKSEKTLTVLCEAGFAETLIEQLSGNGITVTTVL